jgi:hypothetical protein
MTRRWLKRRSLAPTGTGTTECAQLVNGLVLGRSDEGGMRLNEKKGRLISRRQCAVHVGADGSVKVKNVGKALVLVLHRSEEAARAQARSSSSRSSSSSSSKLQQQSASCSNSSKWQQPSRAASQTAWVGGRGGAPLVGLEQPRPPSSTGACSSSSNSSSNSSSSSSSSTASASAHPRGRLATVVRRECEEPLGAFDLLVVRPRPVDAHSQVALEDNELPSELAVDPASDEFVYQILEELASHSQAGEEAGGEGPHEGPSALEKRVSWLEQELAREPAVAPAASLPGDAFDPAAAHAWIVAHALTCPLCGQCFTANSSNGADAAVAKRAPLALDCGHGVCLACWEGWNSGGFLSRAQDARALVAQSSRCPTCGVSCTAASEAHTLMQLIALPDAKAAAAAFAALKRTCAEVCSGGDEPPPKSPRAATAPSNDGHQLS